MKNQKRVLFVGVGVNRFDYLPTLSWCYKDLLEISTCFENKVSHFCKELFSEEGNLQTPTRTNISSYCNDLKQDNMADSDAIIFYFAGHGFSYNGKDYLACQDTKLDEPESALSCEDVLSSLILTGVNNIFLIIDACRNGLKRDAADNFGEETAALARRQGAIVFFGCSPGETAKELSIIEHGIFTYAFLDAMRNLKHLAPLIIDKHVISRVRLLCSEHHLSPQTPYTAVFPIQKARMDILTDQELIDDSIGRKRCIIIAGPSNSGKTVLGQHLSSTYGFSHVEMSSFAWKRFQECGGFNKSMQDFMEEVVWTANDKDIIARDLLSGETGLEKIIICGPRTTEEVETLKGHGWDCESIFVYANSRTRHKRFEGTADKLRYGLTYQDLVIKDLREFGWGLANITRMEGVNIVINEGTVDSFFEEARSFLEKKGIVSP
jgi:hypothetical protein